jgi:hypothetical protein
VRGSLQRNLIRLGLAAVIDIVDAVTDIPRVELVRVRLKTSSRIAELS